MNRKRLGVFFLTMVLAACSSQSGLERLGKLRGEADLAYAQGQYKKALNGYFELSELLPKDADIWFRIGNTYSRLENDTAALAAYREALVRDKTLGKAWYNAGLIELRQAVKLFNEAQDTLSPTDPVYPVSQAISIEVMDVIQRRNEQLMQSYAPTQPVNLDLDEVEVIVLEDKKKKPASKKKPAQSKPVKNRPVEVLPPDWFPPMKRPE